MSDVWALGHAVREIERSHDRLVIEETATTGAVVIFAVLSVVTFLTLRDAFGFAITLFEACFGAVCVDSVDLHR